MEVARATAPASQRAPRRAFLGRCFERLTFRSRDVEIEHIYNTQVTISGAKRRSDVKYITVTGEDITGVYDNANGNVPQEAIPIDEAIYEMFRTAKYGFGEFLYREQRIVKRENIEEVLHPPYEKPYDIEDLVLELLTLLEVSNVICKDNLSFKARRYLGMPDSASNTFGKALGHPDFNGIGGDLV
jgi:hypothetical protein